MLSLQYFSKVSLFTSFLIQNKPKEQSSEGLKPDTKLKGELMLVNRMSHSFLDRNYQELKGEILFSPRNMANKI